MSSRMKSRMKTKMKMFRIAMLLCVVTVGRGGVLAHAQAPAGSAPKPPATTTKPTSPRPPASTAKPAAPKVPAPAAKPVAATPPAVAPAPAPVVAPLETDEQKTIYALGLALQRSIQPLELSPEELALVIRALNDGASGTPAVVLEEWGPRIDPLANVRRQRAADRVRTDSIAYLEKAATESGATRTPSGLVYREMFTGIGAMPKASDTVKVHYRGTLTNGKVFDSSYERNEPVAFPLAGVIPCWTEGVQRMRVGGKAQLVCPSNLAYGESGSPDIPGGAALIFEIELLEIVTPGVPR